MPKFETKFTPRRSCGRVFSPHEGKTMQQFKDECDISKVVARYGDPRLFEEAMKQQNVVANMINKPMYGDFSEVVGYQEALNQVAYVKQEFSKLPSSVRERFNNDPVQLINFCQDPNNLDEAIQLGLVKKVAQMAQQATSSTPSATPVADGVQTAPSEAKNE